MKTNFEKRREEVKKAYPNLGEYTILVLASGRTLNSINESTMYQMNDIEPMTFEEAREMYCESEVEAWGH
jgi:hypothetical protein